MQSEVSLFFLPLVSPTLTKEWILDRDFYGTERWVSRLIAGTDYWDAETIVRKTISPMTFLFSCVREIVGQTERLR
jgi:hypothetical protein